MERWLLWQLVGVLPIWISFSWTWTLARTKRVQPNSAQVPTLNLSSCLCEQLRIPSENNSWHHSCKCFTLRTPHRSFLLCATQKFLMQKARADGVPKHDLSTAGRKIRKLALSLVLTSSTLLQRRRGCLAGLGVACRLYITSTAKMKPAFLKQALLFPAGLMLRGFDFGLSSKIQKISSQFLTSLFLSLFLVISRTFWSKSQGMELFQFLNRHGRKKKKWPGNFTYGFPLTCGIFLAMLLYGSKQKGKQRKEI